MKRRPLALTLYSIILVGAAVGFPVQVIFTYEIPFNKILNTLNYLTWLNGVVMLSMLATSYAVLKASRLTLLLAPVTVAMVCLNDYWVGQVGLNYSEIQTMIASILFAALTCFLLEKNSRVALFNPHSHWWQTPRRKHLEKQIILLPWNGESVTATTHDISESGAFVRSTKETNLSIGDRMQLRMKVAGHMDIRCTGRLVRKSEAVGQYPQGLAIEFEDLTRHERRIIRELVYAERAEVTEAA